MENIDFTGKVAVVTGASRGIGRHLAIALGKRGASVVVTARSLDTPSKHGDTLKSTAEAIEQAGGKALAVPCQITDSKDASALIDRAKQEFGKIDILLSNAGVTINKPITEMSDEEWDQLWNVNVSAGFYLLRKVIPVMKEQRSGNIFLVSSGSGVVTPRADSVAYSATKAALDRMARVLSHDLREHNVAINSWWPGVIMTDMTEGRLQGEPVEVVEDSAIWAMAQTPDTFTGQSVRRGEFGKVWGPGIPMS